jgi:Ca2+/Na+ antiporter
MDWNAILNLIDPALLIVVGVCWCAGFALKRTPSVPDWSIIYLVTLIAVLLVIWMRGVSADSIMQGVLCGAVAVYGHQLVKQSKEGVGGDGEGN